jgi:hypothetical protein
MNGSSTGSVRGELVEPRGPYHLARNFDGHLSESGAWLRADQEEQDGGVRVVHRAVLSRRGGESLDRSEGEEKVLGKEQKREAMAWFQAFNGD